MTSTHEPQFTYVLRDWIDIEKLDFKRLGFNPNCFDYLEKNPGKIYWSSFSTTRDPRGIKLLEENIDKIDWYDLTSL
jgi:hypothetical protein